MTPATGESNGFLIISRMHELTSMMVQKKDDVDYIIDHLDERKQLMDDFDALVADGTPFADEYDRSRADELVKEIVGMDKTLTAVLTNAREEIKGKLSSSKNSQAILQYTNNALSGSGSYMDYKK